ncbi:plasmid mobilization protein [Nocardia bovistercoris]|uniref:Plasmid mobilization relaxosome protein MobC n=1 Tax=Nocardia bovistercoris TaxID=2785916 RepID=A0A931IHA1_9NOCA|nr:plasmid mobilization relaxosome protein MobC [Nocardia bovistercoris]MBH0780360.1 plasmid mobilization relaxosome protein MobC [Nocardia bovistercoris]
MAGESPDLRARVRRARQANVAGGRTRRCVVKLTEDEHEDLTAMAAAVGMTVPRLLVESTFEREGVEGGPGAVAAVREALLAFADLDTELRRVGNNLNQLTRYSHQERDFAEGVEVALGAVVRVCLHLDEVARAMVGKGPAVTELSMPDVDHPVQAAGDGDVGGGWADAVDPV